MELNRTLPTGYFILDIMLGQNIRDLQGNLIDSQRGFEVKRQYDFAGMQGAGKTSLISELISMPIYAGYPCYKVLIIDSDISYDLHRIKKLTGLPDEEIEGRFEICETKIIEEVVDKLKEVNDDYLAQKFKPVEITNFYTGQKQKMMPYVVVVVDTVTALVPRINDIDGKEDVYANQIGMTTNRLVSNLVNIMTQYCGGNICTIWASHLKKNMPQMGQTVAEKQMKSSSASTKNSVPTRILQSASAIFEMKPIDASNLDSSTHPIAKYELSDMPTKNIYAVELRSTKSRTGCEGRTKFVMMYVNGKFDRDLSLLIGAYELGVFKEGPDIYPSGEFEYVFTEGAEYDVLKRKKKRALRLDGYSRPTNIIEARLLINYDGEDDRLLQLQSEFMGALYQAIEKKLEYELEINNVTAEEMQSNGKKIKNMFKHMASLSRQLTRDPDKVVDLPPKEEENDNG